MSEVPIERAAEVLQAVRRDRESVVLPLLRRLVVLADRLRSDVRVAPNTLRQGLDLLQRYHANLHTQRVREIARLYGQDVREEDWDLLELLEGEPERAVKRLAATRAFVSNYALGLAGAGRRLGCDLHLLVRSELAWEEATEELARHLKERAPRASGGAGSHQVPRGEHLPEERTLEGSRVEEFLRATEALVGFLPGRKSTPMASLPV